MSKSYEDKLRKIYEVCEDTVAGLLKSKNPFSRKIFQNPSGYARMFANDIHDMSTTWTGFASHAAVLKKLKDPTYKPTKDHYRSRQRGGEKLVRLLLKRFGAGQMPTFEEVQKIVDRYREVHYVTKEENNKLKHLMDVPCTHKQAYEQANIHIIHATDLFGTRGRRSVSWKEDMEKKYKKLAK
jgi:hypothetical protein